MTQINSVSVQTLQSWIKENKAIIIDVREPFEYKDGHIKGSINLPLSTILVEIGKASIAEDKKVVIQCRVGARSLLACQLLIEEGFKYDIYNLEGGLNAWRDAGYSVNL
ncbi:MAG: rhodanese-like domain-containing protein [Rickettsiaceae bacterium]